MAHGVLTNFTYLLTYFTVNCRVGYSKTLPEDAKNSLTVDSVKGR